MWLLDATSLHLTQVIDGDLEDLEDQQSNTAPQPRYAILSHRWELDHEEPKFEDYVNGPPSRTNKGINKINECCRIARDCHHLQMIWSDTCCIDKRSSAELQEAINSMYRFYERAEICIVYLKDVSIGAHNFDTTFVQSQWFSRGWTLQELIAPRQLHFHDRDWNFLGDKEKLSDLISAATGIGIDVIIGKRHPRECSVAQRMSWAARRVTKRIEDRAYSLLGIFDVNMPMLYGEGSKAFLRLQEEIIKSLDDHSIFAWDGLKQGWPGLLARSPKAFASAGHIHNTYHRKGRRPYIVNNRGIHGAVPLIPYTLDTYLTLLPCIRPDAAGKMQHVGIFLRRLYEDDQYMRVSVFGNETMPDATTWVTRNDADAYCTVRDISIRQSALPPKEMHHAYVDRIQGFRLNESLVKMDSASSPLFCVAGDWDVETRIVSLPPGSRKIHHVGSIDIGPQNSEIEIIRFGFDYAYNPILYFTRRGIRYSQEEDQRGIFIETFKGASDQDEQSFRLIPSGEKFQNGSPALGGHWSRQRQLANGITLARMSEDVEGFWALKADRLDGLKCCIVAGGQAIEQPYRSVALVQLSRTVVDGFLVWDLQIDRLSSLEATLPRQENTNLAGKTYIDDIEQITGRVDNWSFRIRDT